MPRKARRCEHVFVNGECCGGFALKDSEFCYWHHAGRARRERRRHDADAWPKKPPITLPLLEDANSLMITLEEIMHAIIDGRIDTHASGQLLYALQTSAMLLPELRKQPFPGCRHLLSIPPDGDELTLPPSGIQREPLPPRRPPQPALPEQAIAHTNDELRIAKEEKEGAV